MEAVRRDGVSLRFAPSTKVVAPLAPVSMGRASQVRSAILVHNFETY